MTEILKNLETGAWQVAKTHPSQGGMSVSFLFRQNDGCAAGFLQPEGGADNGNQYILMVIWQEGGHEQIATWVIMGDWESRDVAGTHERLLQGLGKNPRPHGLRLDGRHVCGVTVFVSGLNQEKPGFRIESHEQPIYGFLNGKVTYGAIKMPQGCLFAICEVLKDAYKGETETGELLVNDSMESGPWVDSVSGARVINPDPLKIDVYNHLQTISQELEALM